MKLIDMLNAEGAEFSDSLHTHVLNRVMHQALALGFSADSAVGFGVGIEGILLRIARYGMPEDLAEIMGRDIVESGEQVSTNLPLNIEKLLNDILEDKDNV